MEGFLINYLLRNCVTLAKELLSPRKATVEKRDNAFKFLNLLDASMGSNVKTSNIGTLNETSSNENENAVSSENSVKQADPKELPLNSLDTQSILASFQTYYKVQDTQDNAINALQNNIESITLEKLLQNVFSLVGTLSETSSNENEMVASNGNNVKQADPKELPLNFLDTQSILASFQTYFKVQDTQDNTLINTHQDSPRSITVEKFLINLFSLLQEGESIQFLKEKTMNPTSLAQTPDEEEATIETDRYSSVEPGTEMNNSALVAYLVSILQKSGVPEKTDEGTENTRAVNKDTGVNGQAKSQGVDISKIFGATVARKETVQVIGDTFKPSLNATGISVDFKKGNSENKDAANSADVTSKPFPGIEVKKLNDRENTFQIISNESSSREETKRHVSVPTARVEKSPVPRDGSYPEFISGLPSLGEDEELSKYITVPTTKTEKTALFRDDEIAGVVPKVTDKKANEYTGANERQLLSQNDYAKTNALLARETGKVPEKTPFVSIMTDRIEKITEQYANKNVSMDMVVRLKIDEKETLLIGLRDQGNGITVEVKTTNETMGNFLLSQKEEIAKQLEGKNVYAHIYVDVQNENSRKREQREQGEQKRANREEKANDDFDAFIEAVA
jgi:hypothetical protein